MKFFAIAFGLCVFAHAHVHAAYAEPDAADGWATADAAKAGWNTARFDALEARIADQAYKGITSVLVAVEEHEDAALLGLLLLLPEPLVEPLVGMLLAMHASQDARRIR